MPFGYAISSASDFPRRTRGNTPNRLRMLKVSRSTILSFRAVHRDRVGPLTVVIALAALMLLSACASGPSSDPRRRAQDACNAGDGAACVRANDLRAEESDLL